MQNTSNYNLNLVEGTDLVNPPIQFNPNFQTIDAALFANKEKTVGTASEVVTGTVHAIVRANQDADAFRFTATGAWTTGDTMTVDGTAVTVHLTDGTAPLTGAYVIGAEVLALLNGTLVTLVTSSGSIDPGVTSFNNRTGAVTPASSDYDASMIDYDNTVSGLTATDVGAAIDEIEDQIQNLPTPTSSVNYSLTEQEIGTWIDGTPVYEKTVSFGALPNNSTKTVAHNIVNLGHIISAECVAVKADFTAVVIPYADKTTLNNSVSLSFTTTDIYIMTGINRTDYTDTYVVIRYTKSV